MFTCIMKKKQSNVKLSNKTTLILNNKIMKYWIYTLIPKLPNRNVSSKGERTNNHHLFHLSCENVNVYEQIYKIYMKD